MENNHAIFFLAECYIVAESLIDLEVANQQRRAVSCARAIFSITERSVVVNSEILRERSSEL